MLALLGIATLAFEIGFVFALLNRFSRTIAALSATAFHLGIAYFTKLGLAWPALLVGTALVSGQVVAGFAQVSPRPIGVYPGLPRKRAAIPPEKAP